MGEKNVPYTYHKLTNKNGSLLLEHAAECNLIITNTQRRKRRGKLWTYLSDMNGNKTQLDYIGNGVTQSIMWKLITVLAAWEETIA